MTLGKRLKSARSTAKMTQADLASASGVTQQMISKLERGDSQSTGDLVALARALHVTAEWLETGVKTSVPVMQKILSGSATPTSIDCLEGLRAWMPADPKKRKEVARQIRRYMESDTAEERSEIISIIKVIKSLDAAKSPHAKQPPKTPLKS